MRLRLAAAACLLGGCRACFSVGADGTVDAHAPVDAPVEAATSASSVAVGDGGRAITYTVDRSAYKGYVDALTRGRRATQAQDWPTAREAFEAALRVRPHDERALAERGYMEMLSGDLDQASTHLEAARWAEDKTLAAQVWFNLGLLAEKRLQANDALTDFWVASQLRDSAAVRAKLAGQTVCPVTADSKRVAATHFSSWLALARHVQASTQCPKANTEAEASALSTFQEGDFHIVKDGELNLNDCLANNVYVVQSRGGDLWLYPAVATGTFVWMNPSQEDVSLDRSGNLAHATVTQSFPQEVAVCTAGDASQGLFDCLGDPGETPVGMAHPSSPQEYDDWFYDSAAHEVVLHIHDSASGRVPSSVGDKRALSVALTDAGVQLSGIGCKRTLP